MSKILLFLILFLIILSLYLYRSNQVKFKSKDNIISDTTVVNKTISAIIILNYKANIYTNKNSTRLAYFSISYLTLLMPHL